MTEDLSPYLAKVRHAAGNVWHSYGLILKECMEFEDLYHSGVITMIEVQKRYDPNGGANFWSYAEHRVRGAMLDRIFGDPAIPAKRKNRGHPVMRFDPLPNPEDDEEWMAHQPYVEQQPSDPALIKTLFARLDPRELRIVHLRYFQDLTERDIAVELGVTEGRVCQLLRYQILPKLKKALETPLPPGGTITPMRGCRQSGPKKPTTWTYKQASRVKRMHGNGKTLRAIGYELGLPKSTIHKMLHKDTTPMPSRPGKFHRITISKLVMDEIKRRGTMGESVDDVLRRVMELVSK